MRELDRQDLDTSECARSDPGVESALGRCAVVGRGRLGTALAGALREAGLAVDGPLGRGPAGEGAELVLLCGQFCFLARRQGG